MIARRVLIGVTAAALLLGGGVSAHAQWRQGGRGGGAWARQGAGPRGGFGGGWRQGGGGPGPGPGGMVGPRGGFRAYGGGGYGFAPPRPGPAFGGGLGGGRAWGRGQVLPQDYRGADVADPGRYHLRRAPAGYGWVGDGRNAYLMQRSTGMVLDSVPGAYDPPPPGYGRRGR